MSTFPLFCSCTVFFLSLCVSFFVPFVCFVTPFLLFFFFCVYPIIHHTKVWMCYMLNILHQSTQTPLWIGEIKQENVTTFSAQLNHIMTGETINKAPIKSDTSTFSDTKYMHNVQTHTQQQQEQHIDVAAAYAVVIWWRLICWCPAAVPAHSQWNQSNIRVHDEYR